MAKVYVSSTYLDLQECRERVRAVLRRMGHEDVAMEYYVAENQRPVDRCMTDVAACDLYVGIFAWRYGWIPARNNPEKLSITEMEYRKATETNKPRFIFLLSDEAPWLRKFMDRDSTRIEQLRNELSEEHSSGQPFKSANELGELVGAAIYKWEKEHGLILSRTLIPAFDLTAYYTALTKRYQRLDLDALTPPQKEEYLQLQLRSVFVEQSVRENPPPVELTKELWDKLQREKEIHADDLPANVTLNDVLRAREAYYEKPSRPVLDVLTDARHQRVIILGDPGSGKSTLSRYALLSLIAEMGDEKLRRAFEGHLPLLIELRSYAALRAEEKCDTFLEFLDYMGENEGWHLNKEALHHYLKTDGRAVVIFDGLDEIFEPDARERVARHIVGFGENYPKARIVVTSRVIGYRRKILEDAGFAHFTLQDLNEPQVAAFVEQWYSLALSDRPEEAAARRDRIMRSFKDSPSIRQLAGNPMLLTIMTLIGKHQELPRERWKLYDHAASVLIQHWDVNKHLKDHRLGGDLLEEEDKKELLRRLAYRMQSGERGLAGNYIHREQLQEEFEGYLKERYAQTPADAATTARAMIDQFRERNFILSLYGANVYGFVHRAFLEYFCATAFVNRFEKTRQMSLEELKRDVYGAHYEERSWHEVLRLICGIIDEKFAGEIIDYLAKDLSRPLSEYSNDHPPWNIALAVQCLSEVRNLSTVAETAGRVLQAVCGLFEFSLKRENSNFRGFLRRTIAVSTELIGSNWPNRHLLAEWLRTIKAVEGAWFIDEPFGKFVGLVGTKMDDIYRIIMGYATHDDEDYRILAPFTLAIGWPSVMQTLPLLRDCAVNDESYQVRTTAIEAIAEHFRDDAQTLPLLHDRVINDENQYVRGTTVQAIAEHFRHDAQTLLLLREWVVNDENEYVRGTTVQAIAEHFRDDVQTLLLHDRAINDGSEYVRVTAVQAIAEHFRDDAQTLPLLHDRAVNDKSSDVRRTTVRAIAEHFRDDAQTLSLLRDRAVNDEGEDVRSAAVEAIAEHFRHDAQTLSLLRDRAVNDEGEDVRNATVEAIAEHFRNESQTLPLLREWAINAAQEDVRGAAIRAIAEQFPNDLQTLPLLRDRAVNDESPLADAPNDRFYVREIAIEAIANYWPSHSDTLPLLLERAENEPTPWLREKIRELADKLAAGQSGETTE